MKGIEVEIKNLTLNLSNHTILENINLDIRAGEVHCIVGPNGGGKSSLIKCILGQLDFSGDILMKYEDKKIIGYVPQNLDFEKTLPVTVEDFMRIGCQIKPSFFGYSKKHKDGIVDILKKVGMYEKRRNLMGNLSGGERQRVLLAQALYPEVNLLILDEPLTGIDKNGQDYFRKIIEEQKEKGITVLWVHHNFTEVKEMADKVTCIKGKIIFTGDPKEQLTEENILRIFE